MTADGKRLIVFDMDGVLVEVSESYRETICRTVEHFTGRQIGRDRIQDYKNQGGWNNDWALSQQIAKDLGAEIDYETVVEKFQEFFLGPEGDGEGGLIMRERWSPEPGMLERLSREFRLSIFTGRIRLEMEITLRRFAPEIRFDPTICTREVKKGKPAPDGLLKIKEMSPAEKTWYVGDTIDDAQSARAAGVPFVGIAAGGNPRRDELIRIFETEDAVAIIENVNELEAVLCR